MGESVELSTDSSSNNTLFLLDWDDTLLCSSALEKLGLRPRSLSNLPIIPAHVAEELGELEELLVDLLTKLLRQSRVVIVTAAESGWVELSAKLYLPKLLPILTHSVKIISARHHYQDLYPGSPCKWKIEAFHDEVFPAPPMSFSSLLDEEFNDQNTPVSPRSITHEGLDHVISIGDSCSEREALQTVKLAASSYYEKQMEFYGKSMKLIAHPSIKELKQQLQLVLTNLDYIATHPGDLDLQVSKEMIQ